MHKKTSLLFGVTLVLLGLLALAGNLFMRLSGGTLSLGFRAWPLFVISAGLLFCVPPFVFTKVRGLGGLFIPGLPILTTGLLLFAASVTNAWGLWSVWWPLEVIGLAVGFVMAAIFLRVIWLYIPASIVGLAGLVLQFCALTGLWASWAVLWTVVPFSVGLPLLVIGSVLKIDGVRTAGIILCGFAGVAFAAMSSILAAFGWATTWIGPALVLLLGIYMVASSLFKRTGQDEPAKAEKPQEAVSKSKV
ncbi:MAG: hypothetical protein JXB85_06695 [Anaerolineales bacterium]|nr:hypothetical protein [Anaerolineales bacterium]